MLKLGTKENILGINFMFIYFLHLYFKRWGKAIKKWRNFVKISTESIHIFFKPAVEYNL